MEPKRALKNNRASASLIFLSDQRRASSVTPTRSKASAVCFWGWAIRTGPLSTGKVHHLRSPLPPRGTSASLPKKGRTVAARTIPFPRPSGIAAMGTPNLLHTPPPPGVARASQPSRRYRGLHIVSAETAKPVPPRLASLAQTQAIVAQVGREIEQQAARRALHPRPQLVPLTAAPATPCPGTAPMGAARRFMNSVLPAGTL